MVTLKRLARTMWDMVPSPRGLVFLLLGGIVIVGLSAVGFFYVLPALQPEAAPVLGVDRYVSGQRQMRVTEALVHLDLLKNAIGTGRPTADLEWQYTRMRNDVETALAGAGVESVLGDVTSELDRLRRQLREENPRATETIDEIERLLRETWEGA